MSAKADKWAILIGINRYHESLGPLKYAVNDCRRVGEVLMQGEDGFPADHVLLIADDQPEDHRPTYANIHSWLASWLSQPKGNDTVFVYFSGHGRELGGKCYLAPGDATLQTMHVTGIPVTHVQDILARCKAKQKILVLDACHSGAGKDVAAMSGSMIDQIAAGKGIYTITSCDADELSHEWDEKKQGVFSYYLAEALSGACPLDSQGRVTAESLYEWVYDRVRSWAARKRCSQNPKRFAEGTGGLVLKSGGEAESLGDTLNADLVKRPPNQIVDDAPAEAVPAARCFRRSARPYLFMAAAIIAAITIARTLIEGLHQKAQAIERVLAASSESRHDEVVRLVESRWKDDVPKQIRDAYAMSRRAIDLAEAKEAASHGNSRLLFSYIGKYPEESFLALRAQLVSQSSYSAVQWFESDTVYYDDTTYGPATDLEAHIGKRVAVEGVVVGKLREENERVLGGLNIQAPFMGPLTIAWDTNVDSFQRLVRSGIGTGSRLQVRGIVTAATNGRTEVRRLMRSTIPGIMGTMTIDPIEAWEIVRE